MFDGLVLEMSVVEFNETLHATLYGYELVFIPGGVSTVTLSAEDTPERSMVRSTLLWARLLAAPKGEIRGGADDLGLEHGFSHFS